MKRLIVSLTSVLIAYFWLLHIQAERVSATVPAPVSTGGIKVDGAIDASNLVHFDYVGTKQCMTPESNICWETQPEVEIQ